jgi:TatD DNase family protein
MAPSPLSVEVPDFHCHLESLPDPPAAVEEAAACGVRPIVAVGMNADSSVRGLELRHKFPGRVLAAVGLHPSEVPSLDDAGLQHQLDFVHATLPEADALGEVGLDYKDASDDRQRQRQRLALESQLGWAAAFGKPANVHCRRAERDIMTLCADFVHRTGINVNLHWFTHSEKLARECAAAGLFISPGPSILHDEAQARVAAAIHPDYLLLETDAPVVYAGWPARPSWALRVALRLAMLRGESLADLAQRLQRNASRYWASGAGRQG